MRIFLLILLLSQIKLDLKGQQIANRDTLFIEVPHGVKIGRIVYLIHADSTDSTFTIIFDKITEDSRKKDAGFMLTIEREYKKKETNAVSGKKMMTPETVMGCLFKEGRKFFKKYIIYAVYTQGGNRYLHRAKGELIYADYTGDDEDVSGEQKKNL